MSASKTVFMPMTVDAGGAIEHVRARYGRDEGLERLSWIFPDAPPEALGEMYAGRYTTNEGRVSVYLRGAR